MNESANENRRFEYVAIGYVETTVPDDDIARRRRELVSDIVLRSEYADGLRGIEAYSHLIVLFWMDRVVERKDLAGHPHANPALPLTGVFAMRGRTRPNPLGLAVVELVARHGNRLTVRRLDAFNGSPVIDIKPYDHYDSYTDIRVPAWFAQRAQQI